jgi:hypothetical protein
MLPMSLMVGLLMGIMLGRAVSVRFAFVLLLVSSAAWGIVVGLSDRDLRTAAEGWLLGVGNSVMGAVVGWTAQRLVAWIRGPGWSPPPGKQPTA